VLLAALRRIDRYGVEGVGIRQLAADLGVAPNSLYSYVRDKDDILHGAVEVAFGNLEVPRTTGSSWQQRVMDLCAWLRRRLLEHPNLVASSLAETTPFPFISFPTAVGIVLHEAGFEDRELIETLFCFVYHTVGFVTMEVARVRRGIPTGSDARVLARLAQSRFGEPEIAEATRLIRLIRAMDLDAVFDRSVGGMLEGISAARGETWRRRRRRR
jgi:AcrR family transcriptional regulator